MPEVKNVFRIIIQKTTVTLSEVMVESKKTETCEVFSQDIDGDLDVRGIIAAVNNLIKPEDVKK